MTNLDRSVTERKSRPERSRKNGIRGGSVRGRGVRQEEWFIRGLSASAFHKHYQSDQNQTFPVICAHELLQDERVKQYTGYNSRDAADSVRRRLQRVDDFLGERFHLLCAAGTRQVQNANKILSFPHEHRSVCRDECLVPDP